MIGRRNSSIRLVGMLMPIVGCLAPPAVEESVLLSVSPHTLVVSLGAPAKLAAVITDSPRVGKLVWYSRNPALAVVDSTGAVTGVAVGSTTIVVASGDLSDSALVRVTNPTILAAGDIASCNSRGDEATALLLDSTPGTVVAVGDLVSPDGAPQYFTDCYEPSWGRHKGRTRPAVGNHEYYYAPDAAGYYDYFGARAGDREQGYYSYDLGSWHIVVINSNIEVAAGSAQAQWLRADLASHSAVCTMAYWHHALFTSGGQGPHPMMRPTWEALYEGAADVIINGHDHSYERFAPQAPDGSLDSARGIREFVVGTGGASLLPFRTQIARNSEVRDNTAFGVLKLTLDSTSYDWEFLPEAGRAFRDVGTGYCH